MRKTLALLCLVFGLTPSALASRPSTQTASLAAVAGLPDLIGVRVGFEKFFPFRATLGFGLFPINGIINQFVRFNPQPVSFVSGTPYNLYPTANYSATSFGLDIRYHVASSGFFLNLIWSNLFFASTFSAALKNETTGGTLSGAVSGNASIIQPLVGLGVGYEISFMSGFFMNFMAGASLPLATLSSVSLGGTAAQAAPLETGGDASFTAARNSFQAALDGAIAAYRAALPVIPMLTVQIGWVF